MDPYARRAIETGKLAFAIHVSLPRLTTHYPYLRSMISSKLDEAWTLSRALVLLVLRGNRLGLRLRLPEVRIAFDVVVRGIAHLGVQDEQLMFGGVHSSGFKFTEPPQPMLA